MKLNHNRARATNGIVEGNRGMGVGARIQQDARARFARLLDPINKVALMVGLAESERYAGSFRFCLHRRLDVGKRHRAIGRGLPRTEQVEVWTVEDMNRFHGVGVKLQRMGDYRMALLSQPIAT